MKKPDKTTAEEHDMDEKIKPKLSLRQRCINNNAMTFNEFKTEWIKKIKEALKKNGIK